MSLSHPGVPPPGRSLDACDAGHNQPAAPVLFENWRCRSFGPPASLLHTSRLLCPRRPNHVGPIKKSRDCKIGQSRLLLVALAAGALSWQRSRSSTSALNLLLPQLDCASHCMPHLFGLPQGSRGTPLPNSNVLAFLRAVEQVIRWTEPFVGGRCPFHFRGFHVTPDHLGRPPSHQNPQILGLTTPPEIFDP